MVLDRHLPVHNRRFSKPARNIEPAWRKVRAIEVRQALCFKDRRTVAKDHTVTFAGTVFQIPKKSTYRSHADKRIDVHVMLDGAVEFFYKKEKIATFDSKTTHTLGLYRTPAKKAGFRYGPISLLANQQQDLVP